ncbi:hypothetical protein Tco_0874511 [Tanacetum coccineum]|uniref:Uncharacterized protein n=1 Tax=Tanacetum coccineum TaxID=301880 RepID=A0ABQ5BLT7_9ASTR
MLVQATEEVGVINSLQLIPLRYPLLINHLHLLNPRRTKSLGENRGRTFIDVVLDLEKAKSDQAIEIASLKKRVDKLEKRTHIEDIDADAEVTIVNEHQNEDLMFDTGVLDDDEVFVDVASSEKNEQSTKLDDSTAGEVTTTKIDELTLAQTLIEIKAAKPKVVITAATTTTTIRPKGKGVVVQEPSEFRLARKQEEEANIALIESWENTQAMMEADRLLAKRLQSKERGELTDEEKRKLFMELMEKRRKHFAALRAQEKRNIPPTKAQKRTQMSTYLKHMEGKYLCGYGFLEEQESKEMKAESSQETAKGSRKKMLGRKRARKQQQQESSKKQKMDEDKESDVVEEVVEDDEGELFKHLIIKKDEDIAIDAIPLATKLPVIVDYKLYKEGDLKVMFKPDTSDVWRMLQGYRVTIWKLIDSSGVHFVRKVNERFECIPPEYDEEFVIKKLEDSEAEHQV